MVMSDQTAHEIIRDTLKAKQAEVASLTVRIDELSKEQIDDPNELTKAMLNRLISRHGHAIRQAEALAIALSKF